MNEQDPGQWLVPLTLAAAAGIWGVPICELQSPNRRTEDVARARQSCMVAVKDLTGLTHTAVGEAFGRDRTTVSHAFDVVVENPDPRDAILRGVVQRSLRSIQSAAMVAVV